MVWTIRHMILALNIATEVTVLVLRITKCLSLDKHSHFIIVLATNFRSQPLNIKQLITSIKTFCIWHQLGYRPIYSYIFLYRYVLFSIKPPNGPKIFFFYKA